MLEMGSLKLESEIRISRLVFCGVTAIIRLNEALVCSHWKVPDLRYTCGVKR